MVQGLVYHFTQDEALKQQYYVLREKAFVETYGFKNFPSGEDGADLNSHIIVVRDGKTVVGGGRLSVSTPSHPMLMPLEADGFRLQELFPHLNLQHRNYGELSRLAVAQRYQDGECTSGLFRAVYRQCCLFNIEYLFGVGAASVVRVHRKVCCSLGA